jgi:hypothetical protein
MFVCGCLAIHVRLPSPLSYLLLLPSIHATHRVPNHAMKGTGRWKDQETGAMSQNYQGSFHPEVGH